MRNFLLSIKRSRKKQLIVALILIAIISAGAYALTREAVEEPVPEQKYFSQLTGQQVNRDVSERPILGVMIENSEEARPQSGLDAAGIVFETVTEGGITRYLALYQEVMPEEVGPVRSLRPFFVGKVLGFDASIAHAGGSAEALRMVEENNVKTLTEFENPDSYKRINSRAAPHNLYAGSEELQKLQSELGHETSQFKLFERSDDQPAENPDPIRLKIDFSSESFAVEFRYDKQTNSYTRYLAGEPHIDALTKKPIKVKNVVVLKFSSGVDALGNGEAWIFKDGTVRKTTWAKDQLTNRIELVGTPEDPVKLNRGDSWFAAIPRDKSVTY